MAKQPAGSNSSGGGQSYEQKTYQPKVGNTLQPKPAPATGEQKPAAPPSKND
jgi:hypothetical protein